MKPRITLSAGLALSLVVTLAFPAEIVREFSGSRSVNTGEFEVTAPWILDWRVTAEFADSLAVDVDLVEAGTGIHAGSVLKTKFTGNGVRLFRQSGRFYFRVNSSMARWTLRVEQLTEQEAELYTPKQPDQGF